MKTSCIFLAVAAENRIFAMWFSICEQMFFLFEKRATRTTCDTWVSTYLYGYHRHREKKNFPRSINSTGISANISCGAMNTWYCLQLALYITQFLTEFWVDRLQRNSCLTCSIQSGMFWINYIWHNKNKIYTYIQVIVYHHKNFLVTRLINYCLLIMCHNKNSYLLCNEWWNKKLVW